MEFSLTMEKTMKNKAKTILVAVALAMATTFTACEDTFTDPRDGQKYKTMKIGEKVWLAENLRYKGGASVIDSAGNGYVWDSALVACPVGWHLPSKAELEAAANSAELVLEGSLWSSTEVESFTLQAYALSNDKQIFEHWKSRVGFTPLSIRCVQGEKSPEKKLEPIGGYEVIRIGDQIWMRDNINVETPTSVCYLDDKDSCSLGRYYSPKEARNICPENFSLPSKAEVAKLNNLLKKYKLFAKYMFKPMGFYDVKNMHFTDADNVFVLSKESVFRIYFGDLSISDYYTTYKRDYKFLVRCIYAPESKTENE